MSTLKFELTMDEANLLITALCELPAKVSLGLINKLQGQAQAQLNSMEGDGKGDANG